jgi:hypothetical protein
MTTRKTTLSLIAALLVAITPTVMRAQSIQPAVQDGTRDAVKPLRQPPEQRLEGTWLLEVTRRNCQTGAAESATVQSLNAYARGGSMVVVPGIPGPTILGAWEHTGGRTFTRTMMGFRFNPDGTSGGLVRVKGIIEVSESSNQFTVTDTFEFLDANGNLITKGCVVGTGRRLE